MKSIKIKAITLSLLIIFATVAAAVKASYALFDDVEQTNSTISMGHLNLQVGDSDPSLVELDLAGMVSDEVRIFDVLVKNTGEIEGNFWIQPIVENSLEGDNYEAETDTTGDGELDDCVRLKLRFNQDGTDEQILVNHFLLKNLPATIDQDQATVIDQMVNAGDTQMSIEIDTANCHNSSMGDTIDFGLRFHLDQVI